MKDDNDNSTADLFTSKKGRPVTGTALSNAERQRLYRQRQKTKPVKDTLTVTSNDKELEQLKYQLEQAEYETSRLSRSEAELLARIKEKDRTNKMLSTKLATANEQVKTHKKLLERAETELRKHVPTWS